MEFILYRREVDALVEGVSNFKFMGQPLDQTNDDWLAVRRNIKRAQRVWGLVTDDTVHLSHTPPSFVKQGSLILDISIAPYYIYLFLYFFTIFYSTGEPAGKDKPEGIATTSNDLQHQKRQLTIGLYHCSIRGLSKK